MIALLQRVTQATVDIAGERVAAIESGLLVFVAAQAADTPAQAERLAERVLGYRLFADEQGRMNRSVASTGGGVLAVPQFTLAADTGRGNRPSFARACPPERAAPLFDRFCAAVAERHAPVAAGVFGANMQVGLINDGPATFWLTARAG